MAIQFNKPDAKKEALLALRAKAAAAAENPAALVKYIPASEARYKTAIVADDSGSMMSHEQNVRDALIEYLRNERPNESAICLHMLCARNSELEKLHTDLPKLAGLIRDMRFGWGGTPLFTTMKRVLTEVEPKVNRMIVFTDGSPTDHLNTDPVPMSAMPSTALTIYHERDANIIIDIAIQQSCPIDTIYFGSEIYGGEAMALLKYIANRTGGIFMVFDPKKVDFRKSLKYLAPVNRLALTAGKIKEIESGKA